MGATSAFASTSGVVISEFRFRGPVGGNDEFVELVNAGSSSVDISGWRLQGCSSSTGAASNRAQVPAGVTLAPGRRYLFTNSSASGGPYSGAVPGDTTYGTGFSDGAGARITLADATTVIDGVGGTGVGGTECREGTGISAMPTTNGDHSYERVGGTQDTDDNAADFIGPKPGNPQNYASSGADTAPSVASTTPAANAGGVARDANVSVTFSEPVNVAGAWFTITCATSGAHSAGVSGGPTTFTLNPDTDFANNEACTVAVSSAAVSDQDANDPPDTMAADYVFTFQTADVFACGDPATPIHAIQGSGATAALTGSRTIEGVVVGDYQGPGQFSGYFVQEELSDQDFDPLTSEGIFVFSGSSGVQVAAGDLVRVRGTAGEFGGMTQLSSVNAVLVCTTGQSVPPTSVSLPVADVADHERYEGMLVQYTQTLTATEVFNLGRFGEVSLSGVGRLYTPTAVAAPGAPAQAVLAQNNRSRIVLDDASNTQNNDPTLYPQGGLSATNTLRVGDTLPGLTGILEFRFGVYRIQPVGPVEFTGTNLRTTAPDDVGGNLKVASFNVLNYFNGDGLGGGFPTARGAETQLELDRQEAKIVSALTAIDADVFGLMEIENDGGPTSALAELTAALNAATAPGTYAYVDTGVIGTDAIKVALIYKRAAVAPLGDWKILTAAVDPRFDDTRNRPALAQTFRHLGSGEALTVVVNHLKSKGSACAGDPDTGDGSGNCNVTRTLAAAALADWLATDPTGSGDPDFMIIGDLNSYTFESPIATLESKGYTNLVRKYGGLTAYSYVFQGESGYLDHALATASLEEQVTGATEWRINPDEPSALDYNTNFKSPNQVQTLYDDGPYRSSDHDPVIVGVQLDVSYANLCALTRSYVDKEGVANALCAKLEAAEAAAARGNENAKNGSLGAYANQLAAQSGKSIPADAAAWLAALAGAL
ncbi:MAG: ExeM/NucH family extracellular endonuclease [Gaiellaceae bacterium]